MNQASFNLIDEPWIPVATSTGVENVGLRDLVVRAHELADLSISSPPEYVALFRLLLALVHRAFGDGAGTFNADSWSEMYEAGRFDVARLDAYLTRWRHRLDLFDEERPFMQTPVSELEQRDKVPERSTVALLEFDRSSGNNATLFDHSTDDVATRRTPGQAARALLGYLAFAAGGRIKNESSSKKGGLARGGVSIFVDGRTLFERLAFNAMEGREVYPGGGGVDMPAWERPQPPRSQDRMPSGWLDALTWESRGVTLHPVQEDGRWFVREVTSTGGYDPPSEPDPGPFVRLRKGSQGGLLALKLDPDKALWRNATALYSRDAFNAGERRAGNIEQMCDRWNDGRVPQECGNSVRAVGMATDKSKVLLWRSEGLPLPRQILESDDALFEVDAGLDLCEQVWRTCVAWSLRKAAASMLVGDEGEAGSREPRREDTTALVSTTAAEAEYWTMLGAAFPEWLHRVSNDFDDGRRYWSRTVRRTAERSFDTGATGLGEAVGAWKGKAVGERFLRGSLRKTIAAYAGDETEES